MCGIAGLFRREGRIDAADVRAVERATTAQSHRGPDDSGIYHDSPGCLGTPATVDHRPVPRGPPADVQRRFQPMGYVYNGEIYNYLELHAELKARATCFAPARTRKS